MQRRHENGQGAVASPAPEEPVEHGSEGALNSKGREAYHALLHGIQVGHYPAGMRLLEVKLANELGMSRTPVREAIRQLARDGVVEIARNKGATVRGWTPAEVEEAYALRAVLEGYCTSRAAVRGDTDAIAQIAKVHAEFEREVAEPNPDIENLISINDQFHKAIIAASGNAKVMEILPQATEVNSSIKHAFWSSPRVRQVSLVYHRDIVEAIRTGDPIRADAVARSHVYSVRDFISEYERDVLEAGEPVSVE